MAQVNVTYDPNEGRFVELGCLDCRATVQAKLTACAYFTVVYRDAYIGAQCPTCEEWILPPHHQFTLQVAA